MTGPVIIDARTPGYDALMATLIGTRTAQADTFRSRVADRITAQNKTTNADTKAGAQ